VKNETEMSQTNFDDEDLFADDNQPLIEGNEREFKDGRFPKSRHVFALIGLTVISSSFANSFDSPQVSLDSLSSTLCGSTCPFPLYRW
jgi:hypothetical protein